VDVRDVVTLGLDVTGLGLLAAGAAGLLWPVAGPGSLLASGAVVLAGSALADALRAAPAVPGVVRRLRRERDAA
jgi:hypothetical protein